MIVHHISLNASPRPPDAKICLFGQAKFVVTKPMRGGPPTMRGWLGPRRDPFWVAEPHAKRQQILTKYQNNPLIKVQHSIT